LHAGLKKGDKIKARQYLDYDVKTGKHGTALEEWPPSYRYVQQNDFNKVYRAKKPAKENPKSEYRNPKQYQSSNS